MEDANEVLVCAAEFIKGNPFWIRNLFLMTAGKRAARAIRVLSPAVTSYMGCLLTLSLQRDICEQFPAEKRSFN